MTILFFLLMCIAINNLTDILSNVDLLHGCRTWFQHKFPRLGKIATCQYCQSFWLSGIGTFIFLENQLNVYNILIWIVLWFSAHRIIQVINEFCERFLSRTSLPVNANVFMTLNNSENITVPMNSIDSAKESNPDKEVATSIHP